MFWDTWYTNAQNAVSGAVKVSQDALGSLFRSPDNADINPDDQPAVAGVKTGSSVDLFWDIPSTPKVADDISQIPPTWDQTPWYSKLWTYGTSIIPGAVADTVGVGRPVADPSSSDLGTGGAETPISVGTRAAQTVQRNLPAIAGFFQTTLTKVIIGLVVIVVGLFIGYVILKKVAP